MSSATGKPHASPTKDGGDSLFAGGGAVLLVGSGASLSLALTFALDLSFGGVMRAMSARAWLTFFGLELLLAAMLAGAMALCLRVAQRGEQSHPWRASVLAGLLVAGPAYWMGHALASGAWISEQSWAWAVRIGPALAGAIGLALFVRLMLAYPAEPNSSSASNSRIRSLALSAICLVSALVFAFADAKIMKAEHPRFHVFAHALAMLMILLALSRVGASKLRTLGAKLPKLPTLIAGAVALLLATLGVNGMSAATKGQLVMHAPVAGHALKSLGIGQNAELGAFFSDGDSRPLMADSPLPRGLMNVGEDWNVIIVIVDTLRADALAPNRSPETSFVEPGDTPNLDRFVNESFRFERAYAQAAATHHSVPAMFRSVEAFEDPQVIGTALPVFMNTLGRQSFGIMNRFFVQPHANAAHRAGNRLQTLTEEFDRIGVYEERKQLELLPLTEAELDAAGGEPFFGWVHFYTMHAPGWDKRALGRKDGPWPPRYRRSLKSLDRQFGELMAMLEARGLRDKTIIVLASDHGESLGAHGAPHHGKDVFDVTIHVPLVIHVPGVVGRVISAPVGNVDIVPTLADLLGAPVQSSHRGLSLVPLMAGVMDEWERWIYATNWDRRSAALMHGKDKIIFDSKAQLFLRFDLDADPGELTNLYDPTNPIDQELQRKLVGLNPGLFAKEIKTPKKRAEIEAQLAKVDPAQPTSELLALLRMAALEPSETMQREGMRIFSESPHARVQALVVQAMSKADAKAWSAALTKKFDALKGDAQAIELARAMADLGQTSIAAPAVAAQFRHWGAKGSPKQWLPWVRLIQPWKRKRFADFRPGLLVMLQRSAEADAGNSVLHMDLLRTLASFGRGKADAKIAALVLPFTRSDDGLLRVQAARALGPVGTPAELPALDQLRQDSDVRMRLAALDATLIIAPADAETRLLEHSKDGYMAWAVTKRLRKYGTEAARPYLTKQLKNRQKWVRKRAKEALTAIEKRAKKAQPKPAPADPAG